MNFQQLRSLGLTSKQAYEIEKAFKQQQDTQNNTNIIKSEEMKEREAREEILSIKDTKERQRAIRDNLNLFKKGD